MNRAWLGLAVAGLSVSFACTPEDILRRQGQTLRSTDYVQLAVDKTVQHESQKAAEREEIQKLADRAQAHVDLFEYEQAVDVYREAYLRSNDTAFLVKIADTERLTGDCVEARSFYEQYLAKVPQAPDAASVKARIEAAKKCQSRAGAADARRHYETGKTHYDLAEYPQAVRSFKEAYRLSKDPAYLFNVAQSYRMNRNCGEAMRFYQRFLSVEPDAPNKAKIQQRIDEMRACAR